MSQSQLFRDEVLIAKKNSWLGEIVLIRPLSFRIVASFSLLLVIALALFLFLGQYTKRIPASGVLQPIGGIIKVQSSQAGIVVRRLVEEGSKVTSGQPLFILSSDITLGNNAYSTATQEANASIVNSFTQRKLSLDIDRENLLLQVRQQKAQFEQNATNLHEQIQQIDAEILLQQQRLDSAEAQHRRQQQLAQEKYISDSALAQKKDQVAEIASHLQNLLRVKSSLRSSLQNTQNELDSLPLKLKREQGQLERQALELAQNQLASQSRSQFVVTAVDAGTVTNIMVDVGQMITTQSLASILPEHSKLEAHLYISNRAIGFIKPGQNVLLRYAAYPHQKFGQFLGNISEVARVTLGATELPAAIAKKIDESESYFRVKVALNKQSIQAYGKQQALTPGLQVDADILQSKRRLIEWLFEPLLTLTGQFNNPIKANSSDKSSSMDAGDNR